MITAVDVGGTKTLIAQFDKALQPVNELRFATSADPAEFLQELTRQLEQFNSISALSIGVPGVVDDKGTIVRCGNLPWHNLPLKRLLTEHYNCPIYIENDANLAGLAEINALPKTPPLGVYITLGTGIGSGIYVQGRLLPALSPSEAGHMIFWHEDKWQEWEDFASGKAIKQHFNKMAKELHEPQEWQWVAEHLAIGLGAIIPMLQPSVIVFGGGVSTQFEQFQHLLQEQLKRRIPHYISQPELRKAKHPEEAVLYGCYYYATHQQTS
ncbi:MAG: ROK family protein [Candidatus Saccharimonadales bacterium]